MLNKMRRILLLYILFFVFSSHAAASFRSALDIVDLEREMAPVRDGVVARRGFSVEKLPEEITARIFVAEPKSSDSPADLDLVDVQEEFQISGSIPRGIVNLLRESQESFYAAIKAKVGTDINKSEFVFAGYGEGGRIAQTLSVLWAKEYEKLTGTAPQENQIKVITFSASSVGDDTFGQFVKDRLGTANVLDFSPYFSSPTNCGVPVRILPSEQFVDVVRGMSFVNVIRVVHLLGLAAGTYCSLTKLDNSQSSLMIKGVLSSSLGWAVWKKLKTCGFIPSHGTFLLAYQYARNRARPDHNIPMEDVGSPPLISASRGVGGWLGYFLGLY